MGDLVQHFRYQLAPRGLGRGRLAPVLSPGFTYVTLSAKGLAAAWVVVILPGVDMQRHDVIALQPPGPATPPASPAVALEDPPAHDGPSAGVKVGMVSAHAILGALAFLEATLPLRCRAD